MDQELEEIEVDHTRKHYEALADLLLAAISGRWTMKRRAKGNSTSKPW